MSTRTRSPTPCASPSRHYANASENRRSSPPCRASDTASTLNQTPGPKHGTVNRPLGLRMPRLSLARLAPRRLLHLPSRTVRLRLTLSTAACSSSREWRCSRPPTYFFRSTTGVDLIVPTGTPHGSSSPGAPNHALPNLDVVRHHPRRSTVLRPGARRPVPHRGGGHGNAPPARRETRRQHRDLRRHEPDHRLTRAPAADDNEPRAQRDHPQSA